MRIEKHSRPIVILLATVVVIITSIVVANATQTITTPNAAVVSFNLAAHSSSAPITPIANKPVLVMGCCTTPAGPGVGYVSLQHLPGAGMTWVGLESFSNATITAGQNSNPNTHIVYLDFSGLVDIEVASVDTIEIHNASVGTLAGNVTLIW